MALTRSDLLEKEPLWLMICGDIVHCRRDDIVWGMACTHCEFLVPGQIRKQREDCWHWLPFPFPLLFIQSGIQAQRMTLPTHFQGRSYPLSYSSLETPPILTKACLTNALGSYFSNQNDNKNLWSCTMLILFFVPGLEPGLNHLSWSGPSLLLSLWFTQQRKGYLQEVSLSALVLSYWLHQTREASWLSF